MKKNIVLIIFLSFFVLTACKMNLDVTTPPAQFDVPANAVSGQKTYAEMRIDIPDSVKNTDGSIELKSFILSYYVTNLSSNFDFTNSDIILSLVGEANSSNVKIYNNPYSPLCLRDSQYKTNIDYLYILKRFNVAKNQKKIIQPIDVSISIVNTILQQGYFYIDVKNSLSWTTGFGFTPPDPDVDKLGIRDMKVDVNADKDTGSFLILENIL